MSGDIFVIIYIILSVSAIIGFTVVGLINIVKTPTEPAKQEICIGFDMSTAVILCAIGAVIGYLVGEYSPETFATGLDNLGAIISKPNSPYRHELATKYALVMGTIGFVIGLLISIASKPGGNV
ncbi:MAG: hypothetical protein WC856_06230 [Methylococcaceae bacterium]|jgi:uncharacterized protein YacL